MRIPRSIVTTFAALAITVAGVGQTLLWERVSTNSTTIIDSQYGWNLVGPGDLNLDGIQDVIVWSQFSPDGSNDHAGYVGALSGANGAVLWEIHGPWGALFGGAFLSFVALAGDRNGDGVTDLWVSYTPSPGANAVTQLISGATGAVIPGPPPSAFDLYYVRVGDLSLDGIDDYVVPGPNLSAYAGPAATQLLWSIPNTVSSSGCGSPYAPHFTSVVPIGDVNGDGACDLLAGVTGQCFKFCWVGPGAAYIVSGATGAFLQQWNGTALCDYFGRQVLSPGDLDGDGIPDAVVDDPGIGSVHVFSTASGSQLASYPAAGPGYGPSHGWGVLGDVDGDGFPEFAIQGPDSSHVEIISTATSTILYTLNPPPGNWNPYSQLGAVIGTPGDVNGDGVPDLVIGFNGSDTQGFPTNGRVRMYSLAPVGVSTFGSACQQSNGKLARIGAARKAQGGQPFTLNLSNVPPNECAAAMIGFSNTMYGTIGLPWNLSGYGMPSCSLRVSLDNFVPMLTTQIRPGEGAASPTAVIPAGLAGQTFYAQWAIENPMGSPVPAALTRALAITIQ